MTCLKTRASLEHSPLHNDEMLNDEGNKSLAQAPSSSEPYFDSQTVQKNVTGLVGNAKINTG